MSRNYYTLLILTAASFATTLLTGTARAASIVDTGAGGGPRTTLISWQSLAAVFSVNSDTIIHSVEGYGGGDPTSEVRIELIEGGDPSGAVIHSANFVFPNPGEPSWLGVSQLGWTVAAGTYTVAFQMVDRTGTYQGYMMGGSPNPLGEEWFKAVSSDGQARWYRQDNLDIGVRVTSVPELRTYELLLTGLCMLGGAIHSRRKRNSLV